MICENCNIDHTEIYGSGRFCCKKCASSFSTKKKRKEINAIVSSKLTGRIGHSRGKKQPQEQIDKRIKSLLLKRDIISEKIRTFRKEKYESQPFDELKTIGMKKRRVKEEQNFTCNRCNLNTWLGQSIKLEVEHKDGNKYNNDRENLEALCPNCHSFTPTWRKSRNAKALACQKLAFVAE